METNYTILVPGQPPREATADLPMIPTYGDLKLTIGPVFREVFGGAMWEHVTIMLEDGSRSDMFVDEHFVPKRLPLNPEATAHYRRATLTQEPGTNPNGLPAILGPAVVFHRQIWF
tara:strand:- start:32896 stop:33243 length:348 start_codon:yes stop_codon:yes gene_type:complete